MLNYTRFEEHSIRSEKRGLVIAKAAVAGLLFCLLFFIFLDFVKPANFVGAL